MNDGKNERIEELELRNFKSKGEYFVKKLINSDKVDFE